MSLDVFNYKLIRSKRKTLAIQIGKGGEIIVRAPKTMSERKIREFIYEKREWIAKTVKKVKAFSEENVEKLSREETKVLYEKALKQIPERVNYYASMIGVTPNRITIRNQKTRWGSCSSKKNLNFNVLLMLTPIEVVDSVVVHELCHMLEMNHSKDFYEEVYKVYPDYDKWNKWLKENGRAIMRRMHD